jgi:selenoprotein W-related protein
VAEELLRHHHDRIAELALVPGGGGVFEVRVGERLIFSKDQAGRHAEPGEVARRFAEMANNPAEAGGC